MKFISFILVLFLYCPSMAVPHGSKQSLAQYKESSPEHLLAQNPELDPTLNKINQLVQELQQNNHSFNEKYINSFLNALIHSENENKILELMDQFEKNSNSFNTLTQKLIEMVAERPEALELINQNTHHIEEALKNEKIHRPEFGLKIYEFAIFSISYLSIGYSLKTADPEHYRAVIDFIFSYQPLLVILTLNLIRHDKGFLAKARKSFRSLKASQRDRHKFIKRFRSWASSIKNTQNYKALHLATSLRQYKIPQLEKTTSQADLLIGIEEQLQILKKRGLLSQFINFTKTRKIKKTVSQLLEIISPDDYLQLQRELNSNSIIKLPSGKKYDFIYVQSIRGEIANWLAAHDNNSLHKLSIVANEEQTKLKKEMVRMTSLSTFEKVNIQTLTVLTVALSAGVAVASGAVPAFDNNIPKEILSYLRNNTFLLTVGALFVPTLSLAMHELEHLIKNNPFRKTRRSEVKKSSQNIETLLTSLKSINWESSQTSEIHWATKNSTFLPNSEESARSLIRRLLENKPREKMIEAHKSATCNKIVK